ncbi:MULTISPECIES: class I SAM-dependent DNA methyltransferase [Streptomyces]|uniref:Class I SAM-dependent methyltransferase n=1 Tax=Streptomyces albidoflavus TaxID=1886 RepID=A0AB37XJH7_9ACTN|nr:MULTISPECIES: class I SAM-dependent methyltransferase [Streptomyces]QLA55965.1 class I SAM-dependent methyltransferase [Streptomyces violascens]AMM07645.1 methyltransferase [Streptomyces albidoflavus]AWL35327.1 class I SAM-dependent methyltransferase [Streptomyces sp. SM17]RZD73234.1 class I SAM-dependent methyltransferase [Streptomyces albidoflavus]RZE44473.1 class I SAM-dependent methyltransferase [Streptomyces albidoflavus]
MTETTRHHQELTDYFGEQIAATYDDPTSEMFQQSTVDATAAVLAELADGGRALEFAVGTGRIALPLSGRAVPVHGIDLSRAMVARLREKPGGEGIGVEFGDFATTRVPGGEAAFHLAYLVFNTIGNLTTQDAQVACFANAAHHLRPGGRFVIEVVVPELRKLPPGQDTILFQQGPAVWGYDVYDTATQAMSSNYVTLDGPHSRFRSIPFRYVWPAELDLMARLAGMRLTHRWSDWNREPFTAESGKHVSVWEKESR